jgi:hypothetical protein
MQTLEDIVCERPSGDIRLQFSFFICFVLFVLSPLFHATSIAAPRALFHIRNNTVYQTQSFGELNGASKTKKTTTKEIQTKGRRIIVELPGLTARYPVPFADCEFGTCLVSKKTQSWTDHPLTPGADPACSYNECVASTISYHSQSYFIYIMFNAIGERNLQ